MRTTIRLPDDLYREAKSLAASQGQTFTSFLEDSLRRSLALRSVVGDEDRYTVEPLRDAGGLRDGVDLADTRGLADLMDEA